MKLQGTILQKGDRGFDEAVLGTLFNKIDPNRRRDMMARPQTVEDIVAIVKHAKTVGKKVQRLLRWT